jgi:hypothetical protein
MRYIDTTGDTWEDAEDGNLRVVAAKLPGDVGLVFTRDDAEEMYGPLRPVADVEAPQNDPSDGLPTVTDVMDRASVFQSAHALVKGLEWGGEEPSVYDVLNVAKWLEGHE